MVGIRVLVVDDDPEVGDLTATFLERVDSQFVADSVTSAAAGLERLRSTTPDCVVSDYEMSGPDGIEFLEAVREDHPRLPFILFTGKGSESVASDAISAGATDYLQRRSGAEQYDLLANRIRNAVEQHQSGVALRETKEEYAAVFENVRSGLLLVDVEEETFRYRRCNPEVLESTGLREGEIVGRSPHDVFDREEARRVAGAYRACVERREPIAYTVELDRPTGRIIQECEVSPVSTTGPIEQLVVTCRDVTDQREREIELRRYERIVTTMQEAACIYDEEGRFEVVNEYLAEFYDTTPAALVGRKSNLIPKVREESDGDPYQELLDGERGEISGEVREEFPGRGEEVLAYRFTPLVIDGGIEGAVAVAHEVTDHREREAELEETNRRLEEFASVVSHDLRNPLNVARGRLELLDDVDGEEHVEAIDRSLARMESIIDDVLTLALRGDSIDTLEPVVLEEPAAGCWRTVETANATLQIDANRTVEGDRDRLRHLFENLYRNSVEHGSTSSRTESDNAVEHGAGGSGSGTHGDRSGTDGPTVTVGILDDGTGFYVEDDGPGIPAENRESVFEPGYSTADEGTGFGLRIVERIATAHGWDVRVTDGTDDGARFEFTGVEFGTAAE